MIILGEVGGASTFITSICVLLLVPFTYQRHNLKVFKEFQKRRLKDSKQNDKNSDIAELFITTDYSSMKLLIHDFWSSTKKCLHKIWCCKKRINLESEIWPGMNRVKTKMKSILRNECDLLCIMQISENQKKSAVNQKRLDELSKK